MLWLSIALGQTPSQAIALQEWLRAPAATVSGQSGPPSQQATALGRIRDPNAVPLLKSLQSSAPREATFALGLTPGSQSELRRVLAKTEPTGVEFDVMWLAIEGLGRQGSRPADLSPYLEMGWPYDDAATRALLRMHRRDVDVSRIASQLESLLDRDPRTRITVAQALVRIAPIPQTPSSVAQRVLSASSPGERADLLTWIEAHLPDGERSQLLRRARTDAPIVQSAVLTALARKPIEGWDDWIKSRTGHPDHGVRMTALHTGSSGPIPAVGPWERVEWLSDRELRPPSDLLDPHREIIRVRALDDSKEVLAVTLAPNVHPTVRTTALLRLEELPNTADYAPQLLAAPDPIVREFGLAVLGDADPETIEEVILTLRVEEDVNVVRVGLQVLTEWRRAHPSWVRKTRFLESTLRRASHSPSVGVRRLAANLADQLDVELPDAPGSDTLREWVMPDGSVTTTVGGYPQLDEVHRIGSATIETSRGTIVIALDPKTAPLAVHTFASLARNHFYHGLRWHRIVPGFVAQGGCPRGDGWGGPGFPVVDEVSTSPFHRGAVGMARGDRDTAGSQFFVMTGPGRFLDGDYTRFGRVESGMKIVEQLTIDDRILSVEIHELVP